MRLEKSTKKSYHKALGKSTIYRKVAKNLLFKNLQITLLD